MIKEGIDCPVCVIEKTHELKINDEVIMRCPECGRIYRQFEEGIWETQDEAIRRILKLLKEKKKKTLQDFVKDIF